MRIVRTRSLAIGLTLTLALSAAPLVGARGAPENAADQLKFGVDMARRGLWSEALFRFERARSLAPDSAHVHNNLAVALEATGRFDEALAAYREALRLAPSDREVKRNYARFVEFYQGFRPKPPAEKKVEQPPAQNGSGA